LTWRHLKARGKIDLGNGKPSTPGDNGITQARGKI
jgi:hypothetical protein